MATNAASPRSASVVERRRRSRSRRCSMVALASKVDPQAPAFRENAERMQALLDDLHATIAKAAEGGPIEARDKHRSRGKLLPRERIAALLNQGTSFLELSPLAALGMYNDEVPAAGIITGIGQVHGREVMVIANDATAQGIPQIAVVMGSCVAGGAYVPAMSDETIIVKNQGTIFLGGPPLVKAATGEEVSAEDLGGADVHTRLSGVADHFAESDSHALYLARQVVANLARTKPSHLKVRGPEDPLY